MSDEEVIGEIGRIWLRNDHRVQSNGKDRVVYNCSGAFEKISLNSMLLKGLILENTLIKVFLRFCIFQYALVGDIRRMYYQCFVNEPFQYLCGFCGFLMICRLVKLFTVE